MRSFTHLFLLTVAILCLTNNQTIAQDDAQWNGSCEVTFFGKSTLHNFTGTVKTEDFTVTLSNLNDVKSAKISSQVTAKAAKMDTKSTNRDAKMHEVLQVTAFPNIEVKLNDLMASNTNPITEANIPRPTIIPFTLTIKGKKQQITGKVSDWAYADDKITCSVSFPVSLKKSKLVVPSVLGFIKVQDEILVVAKLSLKK
ncbi:MAG: YceI family protein [Verrucomicrobiales bacterium]|nr:YceI family protein [Verrucomicrobiales bacterium]